MNSQFEIEQLVRDGRIDSETDYQRALIADRKLRLLAKDSVHFKTLRNKLRAIIVDYEQHNWNSVADITPGQIAESDSAEKFAEAESEFIEKRKEIIKKKLSLFGITQQDLGRILGHKSKTYMSELMNGISPFSQRDLIVVNRLLKIDFDKLIPAFLSKDELAVLKHSLGETNNPKLKLIDGVLALG